MRGFADILRQLAGGRTYDDATEPLTDLVEAVKMNRKAAMGSSMSTRGSS